MSHDDDARCECVEQHRPEPRELHRHHVLPQYLGGLTTPSNLVWLCPTAHVNTHELLRLMLTYGRMTAHELRAHDQHVNALSYRLACRAFDEHAANRATL